MPPPLQCGVCDAFAQTGHDVRFDAVRNNKFRFFTFWHIQGLWVFITTMTVHVSNFSRHISGAEPAAWNVVDSVGLAVWASGFAIEVIADQQKDAFRKKNSQNKQRKWISSGLWA